MRETLRIFLKDARHLWPRIAMLWSLIALYGWGDASGGFSLAGFFSNVLSGPLYLASWFLIVSAIHEERLAGDRQYWLTRPIPRSSLIGAKVLFLLAFVQLPAMISQLVALEANGLSPAHFVALLLRKQLLLAAWVVLPAVALAAVTKNLVQFALASLGIAALALAFAMVPWAAVWGDWGGAEEVRLWMSTAAALAVAAVVLWLQYGRRSTGAARTLVALSVLALSAAPWLPLLPGVFTLRSFFSAHPREESNLRLAFDESSLGHENHDYGNFSGEVAIRVPITLTGIPTGWQVRQEGVQMTVETTAGKTTRSSWHLRHGIVPEGGYFETGLPIDGEFLEREREAPAHVHATLAFSLTPRAKTTQLTVSPHPGVPDLAAPPERFPRIPDLGACQLYRSASLVVTCASPLHRPESVELIARPTTTTASNAAYWTGLESGFSVWQFGSMVTPAQNGPVNLQIAVRDGESHFLRELDLRGFRLSRCPVGVPDEEIVVGGGWWGIAF